MNVATANQAYDKSLPAELTAMGRGSMAFSRNRLMKSADKLQQRGMGAIDWNAIANLTGEAARAMVPIMAAQNPGTMYNYDKSTGRITVYSQPTGSVQNLPVGAGGMPVAQINTPYGSASTSGIGIDTNTLLLVGLAGLVVVMMMGQRGR